MAINTLATATLFQTNLDKIAIQDAVTGWMDANAGQAIYNGGAEVKIPKMTVQGMANYDRDKGYVQGGVTLEYETRKMTQDRGRKFQLDAMDVNENNFVTTASSVMGAFQREHVIPEIDAYRLSALATQAIGYQSGALVEYDYTPAEGTVLRKIKEGIRAVRDNGYNGPLVIHAISEVTMELEIALAGKISAVDFAKGGINTKVPAVDGVPIIETPANRMYTTIKINDGTTEGQEKGRYEKVESAKQTAASTQDSYDALIKVYQQYYGGTTSNADMADTLLGLNRDSLGEEGQKIYDSISGSVFPRVCVSLYSTAQYEVQSGNYDDAISDLEKIQKMDDSYSDGGVYKLLGDAYAGKGDKDNAKSNYEKAATDYPGTQAAYSAQSALDAMGSDGTSENTSGGTGTQGQ